jgi:hypothetical protein
MKKIKSFLNFEEVPTSGITKKFIVVSKTDGSKLGVIKWHTGYRKYAFSIPVEYYMEEGEIVFSEKTFDNVCMNEISAFVWDLIVQYKYEKEIRDGNNRTREVIK